MSLNEFTEWLAREMPPGTVISDPRWWAPRIAARFATTQPPKPAAHEFREEIGADGKPNGWLNFGPNPAGAVPLPEPDGYLIADGEQFVFSKTRPIGVLARDVYGSTKLHRYGDAREAAGRADAVPDADPRLIDIWRALDSTLGDTDPYFADDMTDEDIRDDSPVWWATRELRAMIDAAPIPQQPAAEDDLVLVERGLLGAACSAIDKKRDAPKVVEALRKITMKPAAEGAGREAVADAEIRDLYVKTHGSEEGWLGIAGSYFISGVQAGRRASPTPAADAGGVTENRVIVAAKAISVIRQGSYRAFRMYMDDARAALTAALTPEN